MGGYMGDQERTRTQVVQYQQGMTRQQYLDAFRQGVETILEQRLDPRETQEAILDYAQANAEHLLEEVGTREANISVANADIQRKKRWVIGTAAAGALATLLAFLGGTYLGDSKFRPHYDRAVASSKAANVRNTGLEQRLEEVNRDLRQLRVNYDTDIGEKDKIIEEYDGLFEKYFGKPPEKKAEETKQ